MPPNVVLIVSDNQSPWTLGCYGNQDIRTPNADKLAREGALFENACCVNPVCSPNRATLLTGLVPSQHGVHNWLGTETPDAQVGPHAYCTIEEFPTLPELLAKVGYDCGMTGKWHLGDSLSPQLGFRYWFAKTKGHTSTFYNDEAIWRGEVYEEPRYYLDAITDHATNFIREPREAPFFLYVGFNGPYGLDEDMREGHENEHTEYYADKELECFPREEPHQWLVENRDCIDNETTMRSYASAVSGVDTRVGKIMHALAAEGELENTLLIFTSDHGLCGGHHGMWGMGDHSEPRHMYQETLRIPLIWHHPEGIDEVRVEEMVANYDLFPTIASYLGFPEWTADRPDLPGRDYSAAVEGNDLDWKEEIVYHEYEHIRAVQTPHWKLVRRYPDGPDELYDAKADQAETINLIDDNKHTQVIDRLAHRLEQFFDEYADPRYDFVNGGTSKAGTLDT